MQMCLGLVAGPPKVKLFLNWFYCAHKYSMPISAVATGDSVGPTMCGHGPWRRDRCRFPTGPENGKTAPADVILIMVSVLNLSCEEDCSKKERLG
jgi:hypothetical protein